MSWGADNSMTSYGGGGGFMTNDSSQPGSAKKSSAEKCLVPITIRQILNAAQEMPEDSIKIDGREASQITFVGLITSVNDGSTFVTYIIDDSTGQISVNFWIEQDESEQAMQTRQSWQPGCYVRVVGQVRSSREKTWNVVAFHLRLIEDFNEVTYHLLDACQAHLFQTRGQPSEPTSRFPSKAPAQFVGTATHGLATLAPSSAGVVGRSGVSDFTENVDLILSILKGLDEDSRTCGMSLDNIVASVQSVAGKKISREDARRAIDKLFLDGHAYTTLDEEHFACT